MIGRNWTTQSPVAATNYVYATILISACSMLRDVEHLVSKLGKFERFGDLGTYLMKIIEGREIKILPSYECAGRVYDAGGETGHGGGRKE